ncbi:MAG: undecaprenyl-diphosphate phosphatase [Clostridiaceae bacterium]
MEFMLIIKAIAIGVVEGITEFLPISSTGHMIIVGNLISFNAPTYPKAYIDMFEVVIQLGAILAIVVLYWDRIYNSLKNLAPGKWGFKLWLNILVAFLPSAVLGLLLHSVIEEKLFNPFTVALALVVGGFLMIFFENKYRKGNKIRSVDDMSLQQAFKIGCFQCLALWPGMSRSASTIMGGWISGLNNVAAAEFSFFLAIPTMVAASGFSLIKTSVAMDMMQIIALAVGFVVSFIVALLVVDGFIHFLQRKPMRIFAIYRILVGAIILVLVFAKVLTV